MIAKRIDHQAANDNYRALALYVTAAGHEEEKLLTCWTAGCLEDDILSGIHEVEATQALNKTSLKPKSYHLMVSFRPEDEDKLTPEVFKDMELEFAAALGFSGHQRHVGVHRDTDNMHLHIVYNQIRPGNFKRIEPFRDFRTLSEVCRRLEKKYGLAVDRGADIGRTPDMPLVNAKVKSIEARTGQESLFSYIARHKPDLAAGLEAASSWNEVQAVFLQYGLRLKAAGNGLAITDHDGKHSAKASAIDRTWSKSRLEARFGPFEAPSNDLLRGVKAGHRYEARPLQAHPERDGLFQTFQTERAARQSALEAVNQEGARRYEAHRAKWEQKLRELERRPMLRVDRQRTRLELKKREREELAALRAEAAAQRNAARAARPYTSWTAFLQHLAAQGQETALAILRSKKMEVQPEPAPTPQAASTPHEPNQHWEEQRQKIAKTPGISGRHRRALLTVVAMRELLERESAPGAPAQELRFRIDTKGTILFSLPNGGTIRDSGAAIHFSAKNEKAGELARKLAEARWGKSWSTAGGEIKRDTSQDNPALVNKQLGHGR